MVDYANKNSITDSVDDVKTAVLQFLREKSFLSPKQQEDAKDTDPFFWWYERREQYPILSRFGLAVFTVSTSSASIERVWSIFHYLHSYVRNRLSVKTVEQLVFVYANMNRSLEKLKDILFTSKYGRCDAVDVEEATADSDCEEAAHSTNEGCGMDAPASPQQQTTRAAARSLSPHRPGNGAEYHRRESATPRSQRRVSLESSLSDERESEDDPPIYLVDESDVDWTRPLNRRDHNGISSRSTSDPGSDASESKSRITGI